MDVPASPALEPEHDTIAVANTAARRRRIFLRKVIIIGTKISVSEENW